jgi:transcriptional regulator with XRE-family HTH domain
MTPSRPSDLLPGLKVRPEIDAEYARAYPHANVALAVARLRGRLGLTQTQFAERIGTTQSVVARLESGRHGIQVSLLNRIAAAVGADWTVTFGDAESNTATNPQAGSAESSFASSGDTLLDAFNEANTREDIEAAHRFALRIGRDPLSPRRFLALAIDAFNHGRFKVALKWAEGAIGGGLPEQSDQVARLVAGRSLLALKRPQEALDVLTGAREGLAAATRAEALIELDRMADAVRIAGHLLEVADAGGRPAAMFLAARVYWHANRPYEALSLVAAFRALQPNDLDGAVVHGAILGYIGDSTGDQEAYRLAMNTFREIPVDKHHGVLRLRAMTAARLGDWRDALECLRRGLELRPGRRTAARKAASDVAVDCFERLDNPAELEAAVDEAVDFQLIGDDIRRSYKAFACALRGDFEGSVAALDLFADRLEDASPADQIRCATALAVGHQPGRALPILLRNQGELSVPDGYLFLAQAALSERDVETARMALRRIAMDRGVAAETARVAIDLLSAIDRAGTDAVLARLSLTWQEGRPRVLEVPVANTPPRSPWEGPSEHGEPHHDPASPVLDRFTRELVAQQPVH